MLPIKRENRGYLVIWYHLVMIQYKYKIRQQKDNWEIKSSAWYNCYLPISWKDTYADDVKGYITTSKNFIQMVLRFEWIYVLFVRWNLIAGGAITINLEFPQL